MTRAPLVALLDRGDTSHAQVCQALREIRDPLWSVWPAITEAMYLLGFSWPAQRALWEMLERGAVGLLPLDSGDFRPMSALMEKYRVLPMDLADAALVRVAQREGLSRILTLDRRDFTTYRIGRSGRFELLI